jgi:uncharacterized integral membrane protein
MQFLKTLFWVALAVILVLFAHVNWKPVTIELWGGLQADIKLPVLVLVSFLLGFLPMLIVHQARMWTAKRRLDALERQAPRRRRFPARGRAARPLRCRAGAAPPELRPKPTDRHRQQGLAGPMSSPSLSRSTRPTWTCDDDRPRVRGAMSAGSARASNSSPPTGARASGRWENSGLGRSSSISSSTTFEHGPQGDPGAGGA